MAGPISPVAASALQQPTSLIPQASTSKTAVSTFIVTTSPSSQIAPPTIGCYFTKSQLALALSIAKSVPEGMPIKDYCFRLRQHVTQKSPEIHRQALRHIDSCEFWKDLYEKIHQENKALQDKVHLLEERQQICERITTPDSEGQAGRSSRKRLAGFNEIEEWLDDGGSDEIQTIGDNHLRLTSYTLRICRQRRDLERTIKDADVSDHIDQIWTSACNLMRFLEAALSDCLMPLWSLKCDDEPQTVLFFQQLMYQSALGFCTSFDALNELARTIPGRKKRFEIVIGLITFFKHALDYLHTISGLQAEREHAEERGLRNKRARTEQSQYAVNKYLTRALVQITQMDWKTGHLGHIEVLEGMLCSILTHTGSLLSHTIFNEHVARSDKPGNISLRGSTSQSVATKFEFRYIIPILHAALGGNTKRELVAKVLGDRRSGESADLEGHLLSNAKKVLQNTLLKSTVGADVEGLKLPGQPEEVEAYSPSASHRVEKYGSEWFLEAVWALVGWDLAA